MSNVPARWLRAALVGGGLLAAGWGTLGPLGRHDGAYPVRVALALAGTGLLLVGLAGPRRFGRSLAAVTGVRPLPRRTPESAPVAGRSPTPAPVVAPARITGTALLDALQDGVALLDGEGQVITANSRWCELVGRSRTEVVGVGPPYPWLAADNTGPERLLQRPDGSQVPVLATITAVTEGTGAAPTFVASYTDISDRVRAQAAIQEHTRELESTNEHLRRVNAELAEAAGFKSDLIDMVSHELSQPLSSVVSLAELLTTDWEMLDDDIRRDLASKIDRNTGRLAAMLGDLLLLFRLDAGLVTARRAPVAVPALVDAVLSRLPEPVGVATFLEPELSALVDREQLRQVLTNLVTNSVEFGAPPVEILGRRRPDGVVITVRDHGSGVPAELVPQLFQRFTRAGTVGSSGRKGAGLGLYIAGHLVRLNGGEIWYEPVAPHGAALHVRLTPSP